MDEVVSDHEGDQKQQQASQPSIDALTVALNSSTLSLLQQEPYNAEKHAAV